MIKHTYYYTEADMRTSDNGRLIHISGDILINIVSVRQIITDTHYIDSTLINAQIFLSREDVYYGCSDYYTTGHGTD